MNDMTTNRRIEDMRISDMQSDISMLKTQTIELKGEMTRNTEITEQVRDLLGSFRVMASIAKWGTAVGGLVAAVITAVKQWK